MDDLDKDIGHGRILGWMEGNPAGRKVLAIWAVVVSLWHLHLDRYRLWDEQAYRICTWVVVITLVLLLAEASNLGRHFYLHNAETRAQARAQAFLARGDFRNAELSANRALALNANNVPACRVMAALADSQHSPAVLTWLGRMVHAEPTVENKIQLAMAGLRYQPPPFAFSAKILAEVPPAATNSVAYQMAAGTLAADLHQLTEAETHYAAALRLIPDDVNLQMSVALLHLLSTNQAQRIEAQVALDHLRTNSLLAMFALRGLVADGLGHRELPRAKYYSGELVADPRATLTDRLQNLGILHELGSGEFSARLKTVEDMTLTNEPAIVQMAAWMQANGLANESLEWMRHFPNSLLDQVPIQTSRARGYLQTTNWTQLREVTSHGDWGDLEYLRFALVALSSEQLNEGEMAEVNWQAAIKDASSRLPDMQKLLALAETWHLDQQREELLLQMVREFPDPRWAQKLGEIYIDKGNTLGLHQLYGVLIEFFPTNAVCENDLAATEMLLKLNLKEAYQLSQEAYEKAPNDPAIASIYAYGLHMQHRDMQGLAVLHKLSATDLQKPNVSLYHGILLAAAGRESEAIPCLELAQAKARLLPEEKQLLAAALAEAKESPP